MNIGKMVKVEGVSMDKFQNWFATSAIASFLRHFLAILIASAVLQWQQSGTFDVSNWQAWVITALVASVPPFLRWLNPSDEMENL